MSKSISHVGFFTVAFLCASFAFLPEAGAIQRNIEFCNRTTSEVNVAVAFWREGTSGNTSKGWWRVPGCRCVPTLSADLAATEIQFLVMRSGVNNVLQGGKADFCVHPTKAFEFDGENSGRWRCHRAGGQFARFKWFDTGTKTNYRFSLRREGQCNLMDDN